MFHIKTREILTLTSRGCSSLTGNKDMQLQVAFSGAKRKRELFATFTFPPSCVINTLDTKTMGARSTPANNWLVSRAVSSEINTKHVLISRNPHTRTHEARRQSRDANGLLNPVSKSGYNSLPTPV